MQRIHRKQINLYFMVALILILGGAILRGVDLTDPPLDFHAWRQLRSASIARAIYYEYSPDVDPLLREQAMQLGRFGELEPTIFEHIIAFSYQGVGQELLWIARIYAALFWIFGGIGLFLLVRRLNLQSGALVSVAYFLFLPFAVIVSRSFLPDVLMTSIFIWALYALLRWIESDKWIWSLSAGVISGIAVLVKVFAVYPVALTAILLVLTKKGWKRAFLNPQVWVSAAIMTAIPGFYYLVLMQGSASVYLQGWVFSFSNLLLDPWFYIRWAAALQRTVLLPFVLFSFSGLFLTRGLPRVLLIGIWLGYLFIGISVPSVIISHDYYHTILVPIVAISLAPLADLVVRRLARAGHFVRYGTIVAAMATIAISSWVSIDKLLEKDYRREIKGWIQMGEEIPQESRLIGLTHDYNTRLRYYGWTNVTQWRHLTDFEMVALMDDDHSVEEIEIVAEFNRQITEYDYFIVTLSGELEKQPQIQDILFSTYDYFEGKGYILFDLHSAQDLLN